MEPVNHTMRQPRGVHRVESRRAFRTLSTALQSGFRVGALHHVEPSLNSVTGPAGTTRLEPKVMQVLVCLAAEAGQVVGKERLMRTVWPDTFVGDDVLTRSISELRRVFGDDTKNPSFIQTIPKSGYRLIAPVAFTSPNHNAAASAQTSETSTLQSRPDGVAARAETDRARVRPRVPLRSWTRAVATMAVVAAVLLAGIVAHRMSTPPVVRVVSSTRLTFTGQVASPALEGAFFPAFATDGGRVYFSQMTENATRSALAQSSVGGGEVITIRTPFKSPMLLNISPDGSRLLVRDALPTESGGPLWVIPAIGGAPLRLGAVVAHDGAWSPDGKRIVFARGEELYMAGSDGSNPRKLVTTPGRAFWVRWSPDGSHLRFTVMSPKGDTRSLWEVSADSHGLRPVPLGRGEHDVDCCGDWTPDGRHFFFGRIRDNRPDIWATRERTGLFGWRATEPARLTSGRLYLTAPVPTRDGRRLLVIGGQPRGENLRFDLGRREFTPYNVGGTAGWFATSRDGEWIAHVQYPEEILWRSRVDGSERRQLTQPPLRVLLPRPSPDGSQIAFMGRTPGQPWKLYAIAAEGGEPELVLEGDRPEADPDWAPDGESLMFGRPPDYLAEPGVPKAIHVVNLKTDEVSMLPGSEGLFGSRWSPTGRYVAAVTLDQTKLLLFDFSSGTWTELGRFKIVHNASWSRDERFLYFEVVHEASLYRIRLSDRAVEKVVAMEGVWKSAYAGCVFEGLAPDDSPVISCHRSDVDIYALDWETR